MTNDIKHAFEHPIERSLATAKESNLDRISLRDHIVAVEIGAFQAERDMTQRISFNIVVEVEHAAKELGDDVDLILSYDRVTEAIDRELAAERLNLLETLAERVADRILREPQAQRVFVRIEKLDRGGGVLGVEIVRAVADLSEPAENCGADIAAKVVFLGNHALSSEGLVAWLNDFLAMTSPVVICVPKMDGNSLVADHTLAQAHIDLLEIEQAAWMFASKDARFSVVGTRTEMDWASKNAQPCVWAPAKFVMDAVQSPLDLIQDPVALAHWLAHDIGAEELVVVGEDLPKAILVPCRRVPIEQLTSTLL